MGITMEERRRLLVVKIMHTPREMVLKWGEEIDIPAFAEASRVFWADTKTELEERLAEEDFEKIKVYQDGLERGLTAQELEKLKSFKIPNYEILHSLTQKGATVMGTERSKLLDLTEAMVSCMLEASAVKDKDKFNECNHRRLEVVKKRDEYIGGRIGETLQRGELGVLFIGARHKVEPHLPSDVKIESFPVKPPFAEHWR